MYYYYKPADGVCVVNINQTIKYMWESLTALDLTIFVALKILSLFVKNTYHAQYPEKGYLLILYMEILLIKLYKLHKSIQ